LVVNVKIKDLDLTLLVNNPDLSLKHEQELWLNFDDQSLIFFDKKTNENIKLKE
jgi:hypothetical protein